MERDPGRGCVHACARESSRAPRNGVGDGFRPTGSERFACRRAAPMYVGSPRGRCRRRRGLAVSHTAIAAALALEGVTGGERLVAFSLASFANREGKAWPGTPAAAARAGLSRARFLECRERLVTGDLVAIEDRSRGGRGRASTVALRFAQSGPWWEGDINADLFEAVLARGGSHGSARLLMAAMAALCDSDGKLERVTSEELCRAAGIANRTYRRACAVVISSGAATLTECTGGRGKANRWTVGRPQPTAG